MALLVEFIDNVGYFSFYDDDVGWLLLVVMMVRCVNNNNGDHLVEWRNNTKSDIAKRGSDVDFLVLELFALLHNACQRNDVPEDIGICFWFNFLPSE